MIYELRGGKDYFGSWAITVVIYVIVILNKERFVDICI